MFVRVSVATPAHRPAAANLTSVGRSPARRQSQTNRSSSITNNVSVIRPPVKRIACGQTASAAAAINPTRSLKMLRPMRKSSRSEIVP